MLLGTSHAKPWLAAFACATASGLLLAGLNAGQTWPYYVGVAMVAAHMGWQVRTSAACSKPTPSPLPLPLGLLSQPDGTS